MKFAITSKENRAIKTTASLLWSLALVALGTCVGSVRQSNAEILVFTERDKWESAVRSAGFTVVTEDFSSPLNVAEFQVRGVIFNFSPYSQNAGRLETGSATQDDFPAQFASGNHHLWGFGLDVGGVGLQSVTGEVEELGGLPETYNKLSPEFVGILSDRNRLADTRFTNFVVLRSFDDGTPSPLFADNLSVAVVPEPTTLTLALLATLGLSFYRRRRRRAI